MQQVIKKLIFHLEKWFTRIKYSQIYFDQKRNYKKAQRRVFIDCGANTGAILEQFIAERKGFEFYAFEPQPELAQIVKDVVRKHPTVKIEFYPKAVWTENTTLNFYLATKWAENYRGGSTLLKGHTNNQCNIDYQHPISVDAIDFSKWIISHFNPNDYIVIKMDIEGGEYEVLEKMIATGALTYINELIVEFHYQMNDAISKERDDSLLKVLKKNLKLTIWY